MKIDGFSFNTFIKAFYQERIFQPFVHKTQWPKNSKTVSSLEINVGMTEKFSLTHELILKN